MRQLNRRVWLGKGVALLGTGALLGGCGFKLRGDERFAFQAITVTPQPGGALAAELRGAFSRAMPPPRPGDTPAGVVLDLLEEQREKVVAGRGSAGQVREYQLRIKAVFRVRTTDGKELIAATEIAQHRDISFSESAVLAKEAEEAILYRDMQRDIVRQILRRVASIQTL